MDLNAYWLDRGKTYYLEDRLLGPYYTEQEKLFLSAATLLDPKSVADLGCGFGRMTRVLASAMPEASFLGLDLSPDQLLQAQEHCNGLYNVRFEPLDLLSEELPFENYDLAVCSEVLLHVEDVIPLIKKIFSSAKALVHETWTPEEVTAEHCFYHDYEKIYGEMGVRYLSFSNDTQTVVRAWR